MTGDYKINMELPSSNIFKNKKLVPWIGGKQRLAPKIIKMMPEHITYCEVFAGGASVFWQKPPSKNEVLNDINQDIINLYRVVQNHLDEFMHQIRW